MIPEIFYRRIFVMGQRHLLIPLLLFFLASCSPQVEDEKTNSVQEAAKQQGHEASRQIKKPVEQAELTRQLQEKRDRKIDENVNQP